MFLLTGFFWRGRTKVQHETGARHVRLVSKVTSKRQNDGARHIEPQSGLCARREHMEDLSRMSDSRTGVPNAHLDASLRRYFLDGCNIDFLALRIFQRHAAIAQQIDDYLH